MLSGEPQSISDSGGQNISHASSHDHRLGGNQQKLLLPRENLSEQGARWGVLGKGGAGQNHQQGWSVKKDHGGQGDSSVAKHQGIEEEHFSVTSIQRDVQTNVLKSPLNIHSDAMPYLLGKVICWRYKLFCESQSDARDCVSKGRGMPSKITNFPGSGTLHKCQERLHLQLTYRYVSLACYLRTCRKSLPRVCVQRFDITDQVPVHQVLKSFIRKITPKCFCLITSCL